MRAKQKAATLGNPASIPSLVVIANGDVERTRSAIADHYGFTVTHQYCADLIAFVEKMLHGEANHA